MSAQREQRLQIMLAEDELSALDTWRFSRRMPSRAAAVRELLRIGLAAEGQEIATAGRKSGSFSVTELEVSLAPLPRLVSRRS